MTILDDILTQKRKETAIRKEKITRKGLESSLHFESPVVSLRKYLNRPDKTGLVAEFKRKSPSKGALNLYADVERVTIGYMQSGASALSILTDQVFFGGRNEDLTQARQLNFCPILRKDFILEEWQVLETKSIGADVILLIAAALKPEETRALASLAKSIGLEVLLEVHNKEELDRHLHPEIDLVGVNNRDLHRFETTIETSLKLSEAIPADFIKISESGLQTIEDLQLLWESGYRGFLMGERFMVSSHPERVALQFLQSWMKIKTHLLPDVA